MSHHLSGGPVGSHPLIGGPVGSHPLIGGPVGSNPLIGGPVGSHPLIGDPVRLGLILSSGVRLGLMTLSVVRLGLIINHMGSGWVSDSAVLIMDNWTYMWTFWVSLLYYCVQSFLNCIFFNILSNSTVSVTLLNCCFGNNNKTCKITKSNAPVLFFQTGSIWH